MSTDPANEAREDVQRHLNRTRAVFDEDGRSEGAIDVGPETIVRECRTETPAATHPAAPSAPQNASGVSEDAGTVESAARALYDEGAYCGGCDYEGWGTCSECAETVYGYACALGRAGLLADRPTWQGLLWQAQYNRCEGERDRARDVAAALEAECARLSEALREVRAYVYPSWHPIGIHDRDAIQRTLDRALAGDS